MEAAAYRARRPAETPLYVLIESLYETVKGAWEDLFERRYGFWRGLLDSVVARYLDCGLFKRGFARIRCPDCAAEYLLAFSCMGRGLCPSCGAKRAAELATWGGTAAVPPQVAVRASIDPLPRRRRRSNLLSYVLDLTAQRSEPERCTILQYRDLVVREDGATVAMTVRDPEHLLDVLRSHFDLVFPAGTRFRRPAF